MSPWDYRRARSIAAKVVACMVCFIALVSPASATDYYPMQGNFFFDVCDRQTGEAPSDVCIALAIGLIVGFENGNTAGVALLGKELGFDREFMNRAFVDDSYRPFCIPKGMWPVQVIDIFVQYLRDHPESRHENMGLLYVQALGQSLPCP